jgi:hypothetical protein
MGMLVEAAAFFDSVMSKLGGHDREIKTGVVATLPWLANPLLIVSFFTIRHSAKTTLVLSVLSALLMLLFLCVDTIIDNEAGSHGTVTGYKAGYWLWVASSVFMMLASLYFWKKEKAKE